MNIDDAALQLARQLQARSLKIVFAESCTGGLVAASMAAIPGVSSCLCGSAVTYLDEVKVQWLGVKQDSIASFSAVSERVAGQMALGVLKRTELADLAVAITGHLGPNVPAAMDGIIHIAVARSGDGGPALKNYRIQLEKRLRHDRQREAAENVLEIAGFEVANWSGEYPQNRYPVRGDPQDTPK
jgi:nicotinamide-nucleotide amidase